MAAADGRADVLARLERGRAALLEALDGVDPALAPQRPGADRWSILQCVEHLALTEEYLLGQLAAGVTDLETIVSPEREARILERGVDRTVRIPAPHMVQPVGRFRTLESALEAFLAARARTIVWLESYDADLRARLATHPLIGRLNAHELLLIMAVHPHRHAAQIDEIKSMLAGSP